MFNVMSNLINVLFVNDLLNLQVTAKKLGQYQKARLLHLIFIVVTTLLKTLTHLLYLVNLLILMVIVVIFFLIIVLLVL